MKVLESIKADSSLLVIPVIVLNGSSNPTDIRAAYRHQAAGYITKRSNLDEYFTAIRLVKELWFTVMKLPKTAQATRG
jgi:DNA-binding NarL/FixJ family response regulator